MCKYWVFDTAKVLKQNAEKFLDEMIDDRTSNPDGSGFYFYNKKTNELTVRKFYGKTDDEIVEKAVKDCIDKFTMGSLLIYHNRYATSGEKSKSQAHPVPIEHCDEYGKNIFEGWYVVHNGILPEFEVDGVNNLSDTQIVARVLGQWMYDHNIKSPLEFGEERWKEYWETNFQGSKVTIIYKDEFYTINSDLGVVEDGVWKSGAKTTYVSNYGWSSSTYDDGEVPLTEWEKNYMKEHGLVTSVDSDGVVHYNADTSVPDYDPNKKDNK